MKTGLKIEWIIQSYFEKKKKKKLYNNTTK